MYGIYKLSPANQDFVKSLGTNTKLTAIALAKAICDAFPIPTAPVDNADSFFKEHLFDSIKEKLAFINELSVIDIVQVTALIETFWAIRYATVYPSEKLYIPMPGAGISPFFGYETKLASADYQYIEANIVDVVKQLNGFKLVLKDMVAKAE